MLFRFKKIDKAFSILKMLDLMIISVMCSLVETLDIFLAFQRAGSIWEKMTFSGLQHFKSLM